jgi:hypothetical protein
MKKLLLSLTILLITFFSFCQDNNNNNSNIWYSKYKHNVIDSRIPKNVIAQEYYYMKLEFNDNDINIIVVKDIRLNGHLMQRFYANYTLYKNENDYYETFDQLIQYKFVFDKYYNKLYCMMIGNNNNEIVFIKENKAIQFDK